MTHETFDTSDFCCVATLIYNGIQPIETFADPGHVSRKIFRFKDSPTTRKILWAFNADEILVKPRTFHKTMRELKAHF